MKVYLIRHAQSEENVLDMKARSTISAYNDLVQRSHLSPLTEHGENQARKVAQQLASAHIERLYSSPFSRALATATIIGHELGLEPRILDDLREVLPPPMKERQRVRSLRRLFISSYLGMMWSRGEHSWAANYRRAKVAWAQVVNEPAEEVVAVAHRGLIGLILIALRRDPHWRIVTQDLSNCGVSVVVSRERIKLPSTRKRR